MNMKTKTQAPQSEDDWLIKDQEAMSLFSPAAPINEADLFAGRVDQVRRLIEAVSEPGRHAILFGERGVGKTSLAKIFHMIMRGNRRNVALQVISKQCGPSDNFTTLWKRVFEDMSFVSAKESGEEHRPVADLYVDRQISPDDVLRELGSFNLNQNPLIIFDEFDRLEDSDARRLMSHTLKAISDTGINTTVLIVGVAEDVNALVAEHQSIERNITEIKMPRMSPDELREILDPRYTRLGMSINGDALWKIITLARGLPTYVHTLGRDSARETLKRRQLHIKEEDVDGAIKSLVYQSDQSTNRAYKQATDSNKRNSFREVLLACAICNADDDGRFSPSDIVEPYSGIVNKKTDVANIQSPLNGFCEEARGSILERTGKPRAYKYRFKDPKMQPYVIMQGIASGLLAADAFKLLSVPEQPRLSSEF
jgi:Cdc6-like AAA superfamily ATPase